MTRGFEGNHVILVRTHQDLKMVKKIVYSQKKCREKFHMMGRKKRSETRQTTEREREREREGGGGGGGEGRGRDKRQTRHILLKEQHENFVAALRK